MRAVRPGSIFAGALIALSLVAPAVAYAGPAPAVTTSAAATTSAAVTTTSAAPTTTGAAPTTTGAAPTTSAAPSSSGSGPVAASGPLCSTDATATYPVICLPKGFGEDQPAGLSAGEETVFAGQVVNNGPSVTDATVTITLPAALQVPTNGGGILRVDHWYRGRPTFSPLRCARSAGALTLTCHTGALVQGANSLVLVPLAVQRTAVINTNATFSVALSAALPDVYPTTSVSATVDILGTAHLEVSIDPTAVTVTVGLDFRLFASIKNVGTAKASDTFALAVTGSTDGSRSSHFKITNGIPIPLPGGGGGGGGGGGVSSASVSGSGSLSPSVGPAEQTALDSPLEQTRATQIQDALLAALHRVSASIWSVGTIAPGRTAVVKVDVKALSPGRGRLGFLSLAENEDPSCFVLHPAPGHSCNFGAVAHLRAVAAQSPSPSSSSSSAALADTGPEKSGPLLLWALLALLVGAALTIVGRRQVRGRHRH